MEAIPVSDPGAENAPLRSELEDAARRVLDSGVYVLGPEVDAFEAEFARFLGARHVVGTASGTDALTIALAAVGIGAGNEVVTVSHTSGATIAAILRVGAVPVLVDVDRETLTMSPHSLESALSERTRAVVPVHLYGAAADLEPIRRLAQSVGAAVVEDCCQAHGTEYHGAHVGVGSDAGAFSFYPTKNLAALGDGGAVVTGRADVAARARELRQYGWRTPQISDELGWNSRLDELQAAFLRVKLGRLPELVRRRREAADAYTRTLRNSGVVIPVSSPDSTHSFHLYVIRASGRNLLRRHLAAQGIETAIHYPAPAHWQPAYAAVSRLTTLRETERAAAEILSLPMSSTLTPGDATAVGEIVREFVNTEREAPP